MAISTYAELKSAVATWINRSDLTIQIPDFISLTEANMNRTLRTRRQITTASITVDAEY